MATHPLQIAVCGEGPTIDETASLLHDRATEPLRAGGGWPAVLVQALDGEATEAIAAKHHLVVSVSPEPSIWADVSITSITEVEVLANERIVPWATRWQQGRRAPRAQAAALSDPDPDWAHGAARLIARLHAHVRPGQVARIDHIGSTSVPGMPAKNLIDIQVIVADTSVAAATATAATAAGFVHVSGDWFGKDRHGNKHPEQVCVDADPGRPVNVNIRTTDAPVARDALLFRDWLRADPAACDRYLGIKSNLAGRQVDDYGDGKEAFINAALHEAEEWSTATGWTL